MASRFDQLFTVSGQNEKSQKYQMRHNFFHQHFYTTKMDQISYHMPNTPVRHYHRISEDERIQIISLHDQDFSQRQISTQIKVKRESVQAVIRKWKLYRCIKDRPKKGRSCKQSDRAKRRMARMIQRGEVNLAPELVQTAVSLGIAQVSASTARNVLHEEERKAMHIVERPHLTRAHRKRRLEFATAHRNMTVEGWKQVIFSDETIIKARPLHTHKLR